MTGGGPGDGVVGDGVLAPGTAFAGYVIEGVAGRGGMGVVYRAREERPARTVAIKVISPALAADPGFRGRFEREADVAATIEHSNVLPVFRVGEEDGLLFLAMRYVDGTDLGQVIADGGRLEPRRVVDIMVQVCSALDAAHARGLVHRDVKPANVLIAHEGGREHVYLTDFGLAKRHDAAASLTATGYFMGTLDYAAPEQFESGQVDARTDVYAAGCMLYHALAGRVPFPADSPAARMFAHMSNEPPSVREVDPTMPAGLDTVIARAMAKDRNDRFLSAGDLGRAAKAALEGQTLTRAEHSVASGDAADHNETRLVPVSELVTVAPAVPLSPPAPSPAPPPAPPSASPPATRSRRGLIAGAVLVGLAAVLVAALALRGGNGGNGGDEPTTATTVASAGSSGPARFSATLDTPSDSMGFIGFLQAHDDSVVYLDVHCDGSVNAPCSSDVVANFAVYERLKCPPYPPPGPACKGAWWFELKDPNRVAQITNDVGGAGSLVVKGYFAVQVQGHLGSTPPEVQSVTLNAVAPQDVPR